MDWAGAVPAAEAAPEPPAPQRAPSAVPTKRPVREHHEECDPPSEREGYGDDF
ncbi:hypothetical protein ACFYNF_39075 [Streptomyces sp. NPDC006641]|uniref:hypothetical protein n=1 Tax=unclassified Streptomyces TaxID=2593676 RepID=UPI002E79065F|nr:hypothetical protein [Streptomyces sp. JV184]MEE1743298.1 hypothetical protein [Streptomyces sp. JV184]